MLKLSSFCLEGPPSKKATVVQEFRVLISKSNPFRGSRTRASLGITLTIIAVGLHPQPGVRLMLQHLLLKGEVAMLALEQVQKARVCNRKCSVATKAEVDLAAAGYDGAALSSLMEALGVVPVTPTPEYNQVTLELLLKASRLLGRKFGLTKALNGALPVLVRLLLLLQTIRPDKTLDIIAASIEEDESEECPGRCGRRSSGSERYELSAVAVLRELLREAGLKIFCQAELLTVQTMGQGKRPSLVKFTVRDLTAQTGLLEISGAMWKLLDMAGQRRVRQCQHTAGFVTAMIGEARPGESHPDRSRVARRIRRQTTQLSVQGLEFNGEPKDFAAFANKLLRTRLSLVRKQFAEKD